MLDRIHEKPGLTSLTDFRQSLTIKSAMFKEFTVMCQSHSNQSCNQLCSEMTACQKLFMAQVSHELRTPLTTILSSAELIELSYDKWSDEKKLKYLGVIQKAAIELMELLNHNDFEKNLRGFTQKNVKSNQFQEFQDIARSPSVADRDF